MREKKILALIPARGGSKGIPGKNLRELAGKPLIAHTIEAARGCPLVSRTVVSTDSQEIADVAVKYGGDVPFLRPKELASDTAKTIEAVLYTLRELEKEGETYEHLVLLQPTSPLRNSEDIAAAVELALKTGEDVTAVSPVSDSPVLIRECDADGRLTSLLGENSTVRRQDMPVYYRVNGSVYVNEIRRLSENTSFNDNPMGYVMPVERSVDIDEMVDFAVAEYYLAEA